MSWFGTFRGRLGFTAIPELLIYATGGLAYGQIDASADTFFSSTNHYPTSVSQTKAGWTVGGGTEWAFARNWSAKIEYLYVDFGNVSATALNAPAPADEPGDSVRYTWHAKENIARVGVNYHFN
jgi:outer membrane immunogenic protein